MHGQQIFTQMIEIKYYRSSVCAADDYINCPQTIQMPDDAKLEDLVKFIKDTNYGRYSFIPFTGGHAFWALESDTGVLAIVNDGYEKDSYPNYESQKPLKEIGVTTIQGKQI